MILSALAYAVAPQAGLLICADAGACAEDEQFVTSVGGGGPGGFTALDFQGAFAPGAVPDGMQGLAAFRDALADLKKAVGATRWSAAIAASDDALDALRRWKGPVQQQELFDLYFLRGVAELYAGRDQAQVFDLRQAAAIADGIPFPMPEIGDLAARAWLDEQRKMVVSSRGSLELTGGPAGTKWMVDGRAVDGGTVPLFPGLHRVTATAPGAIRSWTVEVPVLAGRTSTVSPAFGEGDDPAWVLQQLDAALLTLDAPESVKDLLVAWCADVDAAEARLMRVDVLRAQPVQSGMKMSAGPLDRPAAAAGEVLNLGDGVPATFEGEVMSRNAAEGELHATESNRLRVVFFDPQTRRFSADSTAAMALAAPPERFRVGLRGAWTGMNDRLHLGGDVTVAANVGPVALEGRFGVLRADMDYNFYAEWVDPTLYHAWLGLRYAPAWVVAPYASLGAEVYVPMSAGGRLDLGVQADLGKGWRIEGGGAGALLTTGLAWSAGLGLSKGL